MLADLMDNFVCVRLVRAENLDLSLFRFDPDLAFAVFFMNADQTLYGRFGSRSDFYDAERDVSLEGLKKAMQGALELHLQIDQWREALQAKRGPMPKYRKLSDFPTRSSGYSRVFYGEGGSCTHCHDLRTTEQMAYRRTGQPMPDPVLFAWPMPDEIGLRLDPTETARVVSVRAGSLAERAGFQIDDHIEKLDGQPILSIADVQWVLQMASDTAKLTVDITRGDHPQQLHLQLESGWRRKMNISWRTTTRRLRRLILDGISYEDLSSAARQEHGLKKDVLALRAATGVSRNSDRPIRRDDIIVAVEGSDQHMTEGELIAYLVQKKMPGDELKLTILRNGQRLDTTLIVK